jgi:hypothetical protein
VDLAAVSVADARQFHDERVVAAFTKGDRATPGTAAR